MEINGLKIRDMKDVQDVLMALEIIKSGIENLSDDMSNNYTNYSSLNEDISNSVYSQKELIEGISHLQIKARDILDNINTLNNNTKTINKNTIDIIKKEFEEFDYHIQKTMSSIVNGIDLSTFRQQVEKLFKDKVSSLENETRRLEINNDNLEKLNNTIKSTLKSTKAEMRESIEEFNRLAKVVNLKVILSVGFGGIFLGAILMMFFGLNIAKTQIFKDEQMAISEYKNKTSQMESKYIAANEIEKIAREYEIKFIHDKDGKYILIPNEKVENAYKSNTNWQVWKLY